jgi:hypothetical protein
MSIQSIQLVKNQQSKTINHNKIEFYSIEEDPVFINATSSSAGDFNKNEDFKRKIINLHLKNVNKDYYIYKQCNNYYEVCIIADLEYPEHIIAAVIDYIFRNSENVKIRKILPKCNKEGNLRLLTSNVKSIDIILNAYQEKEINNYEKESGNYFFHETKNVHSSSNYKCGCVLQ